MIPILLAATFAVLALSAHSKAQLPTSAESSRNSATRANEPTNLVNACAAAAEELAVTRRLVDALERENSGLKERLETATRTELILEELNESRRRETESLRSALAAKNEAIDAKNTALTKQDELIAELKRRKSSPWKRIGDVLIGVTAAAVLR